MVILYNFSFSGGDSTLSGRALGWLNRFLEHSLNGDYNDYKSVLLMSWFYLLEIYSTWMRMCRLGCIFFDAMVFPSPLRMITTCELKTDEEELIFWGSVSYKALRSTPVGDQMVKRGIILDYLMNTEILHTYIVQISAKDWNKNANMIIIMKQSPQQGECSVCELHRSRVRLPRRSNCSGEFPFPKPK